MIHNDQTRRFVLGLAARHELFRVHIGADRRWVGDAAQPLTRDEQDTLLALAAEGMLALPDEPYWDRYWELTDKALTQ